MDKDEFYKKEFIPAWFGRWPTWKKRMFMFLVHGKRYWGETKVAKEKWGWKVFEPCLEWFEIEDGRIVPTEKGVDMALHDRNWQDQVSLMNYLLKENYPEEVKKWIKN